MFFRSPLSLLVRGALLLAGCAAAGVGAWRLARDPLLAVSEPPLDQGLFGLDRLPFATALAGACAIALLGCVLWLVATTMLVLATYAARGLAPGSTGTQALARAVEGRCPRLVRRLVGAGLGAAVAVGVTTGPTLADQGGGPEPLTGLAVPDRTTGASDTSVARRPVALHPSRTVVVRPGDTLWAIAAGRLPQAATDVEVTRAWHRLHQANAGRIGGDPDLILPGTRLVVPPAAPHRKEPQ